MFSANTSQVSADQLFVEDVFSTYLYTGTSGAQTITNGIDLAGKGGLVWQKRRDAATDHYLFDTARGGIVSLASNSTSTGTNWGDYGLTYNSNGFTILSGFSTSATFASWTFRKAPKFFDVVTWSGNGVFGRSISHSLGVAPGLIIVKNRSTNSSWAVWHKDMNAGSGFGNAYMWLNLTQAATADDGGLWGNGSTYSAPTATSFTVSGGNEVNGSGSNYVAYLFAHDTTSDGIIQCGSYTGNGSTTGPVVTLGWEAQWVMIKNASATGGWLMYDVMRGQPLGAAGQMLRADLSDAESSFGQVTPTATGFQINNVTSSALNTSGSTYIYIAIRRGPMRTPTSGTSVFSPNAEAGSGVNAWQTNFPPDLLMGHARNNVTNTLTSDRLRGNTQISFANLTDAETTSSAPYIVKFDEPTGFMSQRYYESPTSVNWIWWNFRRAPSFFDVVCYTGNFTANRNISHNLGVTPELIIMKSRSAAYDWNVYHTFTGSGHSYAFLNSTAAGGTATYAAYGENAPTSTTFSVGADNGTNASGGTYVAYLFASCPGVSKVGSYTGNGSSQTINCGFAAGARFVMIKRTDSTGDWYVWDSARGIVAGNDPRLSLNSTAAEVTTDDSVDTDSSGFVVNQLSATNINVSSATYIYLAVA